MALPVISTPTYELIIPSSKQRVKYRQFLVREEKALLIAQQSEENSTMFETLKSVIRACTFDKVDIDKLALFDIEYIFVQLRSKSVGEIAELIFTCNECKDPKAKMKIAIDLTELSVKFNEEHTTDIKLYESVGIKMKYPNMNTVDKIDNGTEDLDSVFNVIMECIDYVYDDNGVYPAAEQTKEELEQFINGLTKDQFKKIQSFFETMPKLETELKFTCPVCGFAHTQTVKGIDGFFS